MLAYFIVYEILYYLKSFDKAKYVYYVLEDLFGWNETNLKIVNVDNFRIKNNIT